MYKVRNFEHPVSSKIILTVINLQSFQDLLTHSLTVTNNLRKIKIQNYRTWGERCLNNYYNLMMIMFISDPMSCVQRSCHYSCFYPSSRMLDLYLRPMRCSSMPLNSISVLPSPRMVSVPSLKSLNYL